VPLEVPVRSREDELVDLIVYAISRAVSEKEPPSDFGSTKIAKLVYDIAEEHDLPIPRSWYMFGTYVWSEYASGARLNEFQSSDHSDPSAQHTISLSKTRDKELFENILESVMKHRMLAMSLSDFLDGLYAKAPKKYRGLYQTHRKVLGDAVRFLGLFRSLFPSHSICMCQETSQRFTRK
jgi:hypothetical protein